MTSLCYRLPITMSEYTPRHSDAALPPELAAVLHEPAYACVTVSTDQGTGLLIKAPGYEITAMRGRVPISLAHELYDHPAAPVIRLALRIYDDPLAPLALETFINVAEPD